MVEGLSKSVQMTNSTWQTGRRNGMIKWTKKEAGMYESKDGRFVIRKVSQRGFGPWQLIDKNIKKEYKVAFEGDTKAECQLFAEFEIKKGKGV